MPIKAYKYRIYPTKAQAKKFEHTLDICCELYNAGLQERRDAWRTTRRPITYFDQINQLPELKQIRDDLNFVYAQVLQEALRRLDRAFKAFFRRANAGENPGYPRFRSLARYNSFTYPQERFGFAESKLRLPKIGNVKINLHRPIEGKIKAVTILKSVTGKWYACFMAQVDSKPIKASSEQVGIDCGLEKLVTLSTGEFVENPRFLRKNEKALIKTQRKLSATPLRSKQRAKRRKTIGRIYERITHRRTNFAHQLSRKLVDRFGIIVFEDLTIERMKQNHRLAKSIYDAAWNQLITFTTYKAAWAGRSVVLVDPRNTSKMCSSCGEMVEKDLSTRVHNCPSCGLVLNRDVNAARNILALGLQSLSVGSKSPDC
jgi:putative transposase